MSTNSLIKWDDRTWNLVRGCTKVSPACLNCRAKCFREVSDNPSEQGLDVRLAPQKLMAPLRWLQPSFVFVDCASDLFHEDVPDNYIVAAFEVMALVDWHVYEILTKRTDRMQQMMANELQFAANLEHIWCGTTVENKEHGFPRLNFLRNSDVSTRFLSCDPLLEDLGKVNLDGIGWVIVGGEAGAGARPMEKEWVLSLRDQCKAATVPFLFKQWGDLPKKRCGREVEGKEYAEVPSLPSPETPGFARRAEIRAALRDSFYSKGIAAR
jgi:protein gp37